MKPPRPNPSRCSCCGGAIPGRWQQWWNRDTGYGLCAPCGERIEARYGPEETSWLYGQPGIHRPAPNRPA